MSLFFLLFGHVFLYLIVLSTCCMPRMVTSHRHAVKQLWSLPSYVLRSKGKIGFYAFHVYMYAVCVYVHTCACLHVYGIHVCAGTCVGCCRQEVVCHQMSSLVTFPLHLLKQSLWTQSSPVPDNLASQLAIDLLFCFSSAGITCDCYTWLVFMWALGIWTLDLILTW